MSEDASQVTVICPDEALAAVKESMAAAGKGRFRDPQAFWFAGK